MDASPFSTAAGGKWIADFTPARQPRIKLLCLPYAGGGANLYRGWAAVLPEWIGVLGGQLPGRETRITEPPMTSLRDVVDHLTAALPAVTDGGPWALFGHSMGAVLAYELARTLRARGLAEPALLLLSGRRAPGVVMPSRPLHALPEAEFRREIGRLGGTPQEVLESDELMALISPMLRADFELVETWRPEVSAPLSCPIATFAGTDDARNAPQTMAGWAEVTTGPVTHHTLAGGHFFLNHSRNVLLDLVGCELSRPAARRETAGDVPPGSIPPPSGA